PSSSSFHTTPPPNISTLSLHDALPICMSTERNRMHDILDEMGAVFESSLGSRRVFKLETVLSNPLEVHDILGGSVGATRREVLEDRKSTRLNSSHDQISYAVFCLKKKK